jgi:hypothetical protein
MDDFAIKPRDSSSRVGAVRRTGPMRTELAPSQSVTPAAASSTSPGGEMRGDNNTPHEYLLDQQSQKLVDRERELASRGARRDPGQALLRMRAYGRPLKTEEEEPDDHADLEA